MKLAFSFMVLFFAFATGSFAQNNVVHPACNADRQAFCGSVGPDRKAVHKCMRNNRKRLSAGCKKASKAQRKANTACKADRQRFCKSAGSNRKAMRNCMTNNRKRLSNACRQANKALRKLR